MPLRITGPDGYESVATGHVVPDSTKGDTTMPRTDKQLDTERPDESYERSRARMAGGMAGPGWHALVKDHEGNVVYDGPTPVPSGLITITPEMANAGQLFHFDLKRDPS